MLSAPYGPWVWQSAFADAPEQRVRLVPQEDAEGREQQSGSASKESIPFADFVYAPGPPKRRRRKRPWRIKRSAQNKKKDARKLKRNKEAGKGKARIRKKGKKKKKKKRVPQKPQRTMQVASERAHVNDLAKNQQKLLARRVSALQGQMKTFKRLYAGAASASTQQSSNPNAIERKLNNRGSFEASQKIAQTSLEYIDEEDHGLPLDWHVDAEGALLGNETESDDDDAGAEMSQEDVGGWSIEVEDGSARVNVVRPQLVNASPARKQRRKARPRKNGLVKHAKRGHGGPDPRLTAGNARRERPWSPQYCYDFLDAGFSPKPWSPPESMLARAKSPLLGMFPNAPARKVAPPTPKQDRPASAGDTSSMRSMLDVYRLSPSPFRGRFYSSDDAPRLTHDPLSKKIEDGESGNNYSRRPATTDEASIEARARKVHTVNGTSFFDGPAAPKAPGAQWSAKGLSPRIRLAKTRRVDPSGVADNLRASVRGILEGGKDNAASVKRAIPCEQKETARVPETTTMRAAAYDSVRDDLIRSPLLAPRTPKPPSHSLEYTTAEDVPQEGCDAVPVASAIRTLSLSDAVDICMRCGPNEAVDAAQAPIVRLYTAAAANEQACKYDAFKYIVCF